MRSLPVLVYAGFLYSPVKIVCQERTQQHQSFQLMLVISTALYVYCKSPLVPVGVMILVHLM